MPSLPWMDSCLSHDAVGGLFFDFEAVRTEQRCSAQANVIGFPGGHFSFGAGRNFDRFKLRDQPMILSAELR